MHPDSQERGSQQRSFYLQHKLMNSKPTKTVQVVEPTLEAPLTTDAPIVPVDISAISRIEALQVQALEAYRKTHPVIGAGLTLSGVGLIWLINAGAPILHTIVTSLISIATLCTAGATSYKVWEGHKRSQV